MVSDSVIGAGSVVLQMSVFLDCSNTLFSVTDVDFTVLLVWVFLSFVFWFFYFIHACLRLL